MSRRPPPPPGFTLDDDDENQSPPSGFSIDQPRPQPSSTPPMDLGEIVRALDGDTAATTSGRNVRLYGVDAPELRQQGWNRQGSSVAIGQQSQRSLSEAFQRAQGIIGDAVGSSYGRAVAPISVDGQDVAQQLARHGNALAAPDYLRRDPDRRFDYMQAERLARQNRLGVHATLNQPPAEYRKTPMPAPSREEVAQFFDTPTPLAGMRPEAEQQYFAMLNDHSVEPEKIVEFARANGFTVDPAKITEVREYARETKQPIQIGYRDTPRPLTDLGDGAAGAGVRGVGSGVLAGGLDEVGAFADMAGLTPGRENVFNSDRRLADIWANNQGQNAAILGYDRFAHPYAELAGQIGGGLLVPFGAKARTVPQLFRVGAAYGGVEGFLGTEGDVGQRAIGAAIGVPVGGALGAGAGKALELGLKAAPRLSGYFRRGGGSEAPPATVDASNVVSLDAPRVSDVIDIGDVPAPPPGYTVDAPAPTQIDDYLGQSAQEVSAKDFLYPLQGDDMRAAVIAPNGRIHIIDAPEGHVGFRNAVGEEAGRYAEITNYRDEFALRRPENVTAAQLRTINELGARARREGVHLTEGGFEGGPSPAMARQRDIIDISEIPAPPPGYRLDTHGSLAMAADPMPSITQELPRQRDYLDVGGVRPSRLIDPLTQEQMQAAANDVLPRDVVPIPSNQVGSIEEAMDIDAGRFGPARAPNERDELTRRTVRAYGGAQVPKAGPVDMVSWLRLQGGLANQGGELSHMGLSNSARKMDFAGQEQRFGPLVNPQGMNLDDAAMRAWESGYFPDHTDRPTTSEFLDALRDTYEGRNRRFLAEDYPEIDRFYGARQDRHALEQQRFETGQPVLADRSMPAGEDMPFPPVQAYEEWPSGGPDFAGNIRLANLESPWDIARALSVTAQRVPFDAQTRGRVSHAETERLAADLGMTAENLLSRRRGQAFNAEEALAARQILAKSGNELVNAARRVQALDNPGDEVLADFRQKWMRHAAIQEQVSGMTAEAGRALQQFRMAADSRALRRDVLSATVRSGGGPDQLRNAADLLLEAVEDSPGKFNATVQKAAKASFRNMFDEFYINALVSGPQTHAVNITSNTLTSLAQIPEHATAALIGKARQALPGANRDRVIASEVGRRIFGLIQGAKEGAHYFAQALKTGEAMDWVSKVEGQEMKAIPGLFGEVVRGPTRLLTAEDELFKGIARRMELQGLAARQAHSEGLKGEAAARRIAELAENPPDDMWQRSMNYARYLTFQQPLGPRMAKISGFVQDTPGARQFLPFIRTPTNLLKFAVERSPAAPILKEWRADYRAGGARRDLAVAKAMLGTGLGATMYAAALNGQITGTVPPDPKKAKLLYADGWKPYSIKIGDTYYSYKRLDPFATTIGTAADLALLPEGMSQRQRDDMVTLFTASILGNLASKTWLSGISDLVSALEDPQRNADSMMQRLIGSIAVPVGVAQIARTMDPVARETETLGDAIQSRIPGLTSGLLPRRNVWGEEITNEGGVGPDIVSPIWQSTIKNDPVNREMLAVDYAPGNLPHTIGGEKLSSKDYNRYQEVAGQKMHRALQRLIASPGWMQMDLDARQDAAEKTASKARREARALIGKAPLPKRSRYKEAAAILTAPTPPAGFTVEGDAGGRNVYADLQQAIPGVRFTSGFRTPEYQADMRKRGYRPALNSGHLDGSSLDLLPPQGKSMSWLRDRVKAYDAAAKILNEGDHLHVTFPGYYGAPVLGGARSAGIRNPNAGMPPPPPGFKLEN